MKILEIVTGLGEGDGKAEAVCGLAKELAKRGHSVTVAIRAEERDPLSMAANAAMKAGVRVVRFAPSRPGFLFFSRAMLTGLRTLVRQADIVHVNGSWTFPVWWGCRCAVKEGKKLVLTPHGSFDPLRIAHGVWKKRLAAPFDKWCLRHASVVQATSGEEEEWIKRFAGVGSAVIPIGVELPVLKSSRWKERRVVLYLGRRHPLKGLDLLEAAWAEAGRPDWCLKLMGPGLPDGEVVGEEKWRAVAEADCLVLPTRSENFGIVVAEALASGKPVICTKAAPWQELVAEHCGWWCDVSVRGIAEALREMMGLEDIARAAMGMSGRKLIERKYVWPRIADEFEKFVGR